MQIAAEEICLTGDQITLFLSARRKLADIF
jgi:hypothetical protein